LTSYVACLIEELYSIPLSLADWGLSHLCSRCRGVGTDSYSTGTLLPLEFSPCEARGIEISLGSIEKAFFFFLLPPLFRFLGRREGARVFSS